MLGELKLQHSQEPTLQEGHVLSVPQPQRLGLFWWVFFVFLFSPKTFLVLGELLPL